MTVAVKRYLGLDLSLSPGLAVIDVRGRLPTLVYAGSVATSTADPDAVRAITVESFIASAVYRYRPFTAVIREDFIAGRNKRATQTIFSAWAAADRALHTYGLVDLERKPIPPTTVKKTVAGAGKAEKADVAVAVRRLLRLDESYAFATGYDDSDAAAVALAYLIAEKLIDN